jgi:MFS family permease
MTVSWFGLALTREPESIITKPRTPIWRYFRQLPAILRSNHNYRRFLLSRTIIQLGTLASGFYMVYGIERFAVDGTGVGQLTATLVGSTAAMNLAWGVIGDRLGHKLVLVCSATALVFAALNAWAAPSAGWLFFTFVLLGVYIGGDGVSAMNIILEFCRPQERPTYVGLTNTLLAPMLSLAPLLGGWLATVAGYHGLFLVAAVITAVGACLMGLWTHEPRIGARVVH